MRIVLDDLSDPRVAAFLEEHLADMRRLSPPESVHALDLDGLRQPDVQFWTAWSDDGEGREQLIGTAALKRLGAHHVELKSMRTAARLRGRGITAPMNYLICAGSMRCCRGTLMRQGSRVSTVPPVRSVRGFRSRTVWRWRSGRAA